MIPGHLELRSWLEILPWRGGHASGAGGGWRLPAQPRVLSKITGPTLKNVAGMGLIEVQGEYSPASTVSLMPPPQVSDYVSAASAHVEADILDLLNIIPAR